MLFNAVSWTLGKVRPRLPFSHMVNTHLILIPAANNPTGYPVRPLDPAARNSVLTTCSDRMLHSCATLGGARLLLNLRAAAIPLVKGGPGANTTQLTTAGERSTVRWASSTAYEEEGPSDGKEMLGRGEVIRMNTMSV